MTDKLYGTLYATDNLSGTIGSNNSLAGVVGIGGGSGSSDYNDLRNKPSINEVVLIGNKTLPQLDIQPTNVYADNIDIDNLFN